MGKQSRVIRGERRATPREANRPLKSRFARNRSEGVPSSGLVPGPSSGSMAISEDTCVRPQDTGEALNMPQPFLALTATQHRSIAIGYPDMSRPGRNVEAYQRLPVPTLRRPAVKVTRLHTVHTYHGAAARLLAKLRLDHRAELRLYGSVRHTFVKPQYTWEATIIPHTAALVTTAM